jgi:outer membrane biogenesis lipoprotein LolB
MPTLARFLLFGAAFLCACATSHPRPASRTEIRDPAELIDRVYSQTGTMVDARIRARVSMKIDGVRQNASSVIFFRSPADLRLEISGTLGVSIMSAKFWGDSVRVYLPSENGYLAGRAARVLYQVTGMDLSYYDLERVLLGLPSIQPSDRDQIIGFHTEEKSYTIDTHVPRGRRRTWIDRSALVVTREDVFDRWDALQTQLRLGEYKTISGSVLARKITIRQGQNQIALSVESHKLNTGLEDTVFDQALPPGAQPLDSEQ